MGEFGFITADGIYHVTVYATDENGDFRILKMKNIKVGFRKFRVLIYLCRARKGASLAPGRNILKLSDELEHLKVLDPL
jgi:hypothetical protein